ncbi:hypothetical protein BKA62DRAFT_723978 [Auriculariales sp. MPI-PUGE-AT-0066]|nr:hypothetical protein BKA62DRAFT_723978 [Auriculariales sp. MPI-PUGE-AT-0066]
MRVALGPATSMASALAHASTACPIPALRPILGIAVLCLDAVNEAQRVDETARLLVLHVAEMAMVITQETAQSEKESTYTLAQNVLDSLRELETCMSHIADCLQRMVGLGRVTQLLQRSTLATEIKSLRNDLDFAWQAFRISMTISTTRELHRQAELRTAHSEAIFGVMDANSARTPSADAPSFTQVSPSNEVLFGRDAQVNQVVQIVGDKFKVGAKLVMLGPGGIGKTSLARAVLSDQRIVAIYQDRRIFVSCESSVDSKSLLISIGMALGMSGNDLNVRVLHILSERPTLLILDNFETPWERPEARGATESLLALISTLPGLAFIVTLRGTERPLGVQWSTPPIPILGPLDRSAALQTIYTQLPMPANTESSSLHALLDAVGDLPLAVAMIAALMRFESAEELLARWMVERTSMLNLGGADRMSSLDTSIRISLDGPRLRGNPDARALLSVISLFPDGFCDAHIELFSADLRRIRQAVSLLKQSALIYTSAAATLRAHPLIREHVLRHHSIPRHLLGGLIAYCTNLLSLTRKFRTDAEAVNQAVLPELKNLDAVLTYLLRSDIPEGAELLQYIPSLTLCALSAGITQPNTLQAAIARAQRVRNFSVAVELLAHLASFSADQIAARQYAQEALAISANLHDPYIRAMALKAFAALPLTSRDEAEPLFLKVLDLLSGAEQTPDVMRLHVETYTELASKKMQRASDYRNAQKRAYLLEAERLARELHHNATVSEIQVTLAHDLLRDGRYLLCEREARRLYQAARETKNIFTQMRAQRLLYATMTRRGDHRRAIEYVRQVSRFWKQLGRTQNYAAELIMQVELMIRDRDFVQAEQLVRDAIALQDSAGLTDVWPYKRSLIAHARVLIEMGELDRAETCLRRSFTDAEGHMENQADHSIELAKLHLARRNHHLSLRYFVVGLVQWRRTGDVGETLERLVNYAQFSAATGDPQTGWNVLSIVLPFQLSSGAAWEAAQCLLAMVELQVKSGRALQLNSSELDPPARLKEAYKLLSANGCDSGVQQCYELARHTGLDWALPPI